MSPPSGSNYRSAVVALLLAMALLITACGGESESAAPELASLADAAEVSDDATTSDTGEIDEIDEAERTFEDAQLDFAACMRESGIESWPDPEPGADGPGAFRNLDFEALGIDPQSADFRETIDECRGEFEGVAGGQGELSPEEEAERLDDQIALAECIRQNPGWEDFPDPDPNGGGFAGVRELFQAGDLDVEAFRELAQTCATELGIEAGPGGGAGRGPGA